MSMDDLETEETGDPGIGHNSIGGTARDQLRAFVERVERLEEEKDGIAQDIREVYSEAKAGGFDTKVLRKVVRLRKMDAKTRDEQQAILVTYLHALGMGDVADLAQ